jgi:actin-related protein
MMTKGESQKENEAVKLITSSKVAEMFEKVRTKLISAHSPPSVQPELPKLHPKPQCKKIQDGEGEASAQLVIPPRVSQTLMELSTAHSSLPSQLEESPPPLPPKLRVLGDIQKARPFKSPTERYFDGKSVIVIDNGSGFIKAGFAGNESPMSVFPSVVRHSQRRRKYYIGREAENRRSVLPLRYPIQRGVITDWDDMEKLWDHIFCNELGARLEPEEHPILLVESASNLPNRRKMMEIMFETYYAPSTCVINSGPPSLFALGKKTGVVVNIGDGVCTIVPIHNGSTIATACSQVYLGGCDIREYYVRLLVQKGFNSIEATRVSEHNTFYVAQLAELNYSLPSDFQCVEPLFNPSLLQLSFEGVHHLTYNSIMKCEPDVRKDLFSNIVLSGGSTTFPGFAKRLQEELIALVPPLTNINIVTSPQQRYLPWIGGSMLATVPNYQWLWMNREEYGEAGRYYSVVTF